MTTTGEMRGQLVDTSGGSDRRLLFEIVARDNGFQVSFDGYGNCEYATGNGGQIFVEYLNGSLTLSVFADFNSCEPTHVIPLRAAKEPQ